MKSGFEMTICRSKRPGRKQRGIEHVGPVGRGDDDDAFVLLEAVHLDQQLVERLLALVVAAAEARAAMAPDRVDFVDEDDAGRVLLGLLEHVAHAARADADEHFDEVGARDGEERHVGFARHRARRQRLAGAGRADQQHAARDAPAELLELLRIAQEFDDLLQVFLGLVDAGDVLEGDAALRLVEQLGLRLAEAHRLAGAALHLARHVDPHAEEQQQRQAVDEQGQQPGIAVRRRPGGDRDVLLVERVDEAGVARRIGDEGAAVLVVAARCPAPAMVTSRTWPASTSVSNWLNVMSLLGVFWAGLWNRVTSASTSRKMITQRAKLRKFGFIGFPSTAAPPRNSGPARPSQTVI